MTHAAVWLDHREARIFHLASPTVAETTVLAPHHQEHRHPKGEAGAKEHPEEELHFFQALARSLVAYNHILVVGPANAKHEFVKYAADRDHALRARIDGVETVDHPTDGQVAAYGKKFFKIVDD